MIHIAIYQAQPYHARVFPNCGGPIGTLMWDDLRTVSVGPAIPKRVRYMTFDVDYN